MIILTRDQSHRLRRIGTTGKWVGKRDPRELPLAVEAARESNMVELLRGSQIDRISWNLLDRWKFLIEGLQRRKNG